jgi:hypothetical protein
MSPEQRARVVEALRAEFKKVFGEKAVKEATKGPSPQPLPDSKPKQDKAKKEEKNKKDDKK